MSSSGFLDPIRILLADDQSLFRQSLRFMLERKERFSVVGEAKDGIEAVAKARELMPDIILMDVRMPHCSGLDALKQVQKELPSIRVVMLTVSEDDEDLFAAVRAGARGYLLKSITADEVVRSLEHIGQGGAVVSPQMAVKLLDEFAAIEASEDDALGVDVTKLTAREEEILKLLGQGLGNKEIAASLCIAETTVKGHLRNVMEKLHIHNRTQAAAYAVRSKLLAKRRAKAP